MAIKLPRELPGIRQAVVNLLGYSRDEIINKNIIDISLPEEIRSNVRDFQRPFRGEKLFKEFNLIRKDGSPVPVDLMQFFFPMALSTAAAGISPVVNSPNKE